MATVDDEETQSTSSLPSSPSQSRSPTPEYDPSMPLPGRSGVYIDNTGMVTMYYGDDILDEESYKWGGHLANFVGALAKSKSGEDAPGPLGTMGDGETRCPVFCIADIPTTTLDLLLECSEEYLSEFNTPSYSALVSDRIVIMDTKDIADITKGSSVPVASSPTAFVGLSLEEVRDWFVANITQPAPKGFMPHCFLVLDDESTEDESCIFVCTQNSAPGEIHSLRCDFALALRNAVVCGVQDKSIEEGILGNFMRSGETMTPENLKLVEDNGLYIEDGEVKLDEAWRDFKKW